MDYSISKFEKKLRFNGLTISPKTYQQPAGIRIYNGRFSGEKAEIIVWYNTKSKRVYRAKAMICRHGKDQIERLTKTIKGKLDAKYGVSKKYSEETKDAHQQKYTKCLYYNYCGTVELYISSTDFDTDSDYYLHVDYKDKENYSKYGHNEIDDI